METTINKRISAKNMLNLFHNFQNKYSVNIRQFKAANFNKEADLETVYTYEITIRHNEDEDAETIFKTAINQL